MSSKPLTYQDIKLNIMMELGTILDKFAAPLMSTIQEQAQQIKVLTDKLPKKERIKIIKKKNPYDTE